MAARSRARCRIAAESGAASPAERYVAAEAASSRQREVPLPGRDLVAGRHAAPSSMTLPVIFDRAGRAQSAGDTYANG